MAPVRLGESFDAVLRGAQVGAGWALERLWCSYSGSVTGYLRVQGVSEPEDIASEVFLGAFRSIARFEGDEAAFRSWLFTIAHRKVLDGRQRGARRPQLTELRPDVASPAADDPDDEVLRRLATEHVRTLCERLVPDQRDVLLLRLVAGLTVEEVAAMLHKTPGAVKALQRRGLGALRKIFEREAVPL